jgi:cardiolipin synthase
MNNHPKHRDCAQQLLTSPSAIFSSLIADLQHARETIDMEYYIFANDRTGRLFADILSRKARQGLRVRLIVDGYGSRSLSSKLRKLLEQEGYL